ncbi:MAG: 2-hydroxycyclohexanecarboxyl-CoA dehydrogenase [Actinomycetota bacterium]|jgi:NAD(P)-dependent dehydrogenase (short-subunit alcohol dehydrogenase family)|nr:2-hydroxycyclohexanecarboxyl-CoA dehydrogenase [Actinomycetota bacterium]
MPAQFPRVPVALVTGAAQGLGHAIATRLAHDGHLVIVNDKEDSAALTDLATQIGGLALAADVADPEAVTELVSEVAQRFGWVDVLVANHAAMAMAPFLDMAPAPWWEQVEVNLSGTFRLVQAVLPGMRRAGAGRIVLIASEAGVVGMRNATAYSASKGGLIALTKSLGRELAREGIVTNAIAPSYVDTPQLQVDAADAGVSIEDIKAAAAGRIPMGRIATPQEIAAVTAFLVSPGAGSLVGQVLQPNGGTTRTRA